MAAFLPALAGLASAGSAVASMAKRTKKRAAKRDAQSKAVVLYDPVFAAKQTRKAAMKRAPRRKTTAGRLSVATPALQTTFSGTGNTLEFCGTADRNADIDNRGSLKITGSGLFGSSGNGAMIGSALKTSVSNGSLLTSGTGASVATMFRIGVSELDIRIGYIAAVWSHYAIRKLVLKFIPSVSQYNYGSFQTANVGFALTDETDAWGGTTPTLAAAMDFPVKSFGPLYQPQTMVYTHRGSRTWYTSTTGEGDLGEANQLAIFAGCDPTTIGLTAGTVGNWWASWELDLYRPAPPVANESLRLGPEAMLPSQATADVKDHKSESTGSVVKEPTASTQSKDPSQAYAKPALTRSASRDSLFERAIAHVRSGHYPAAPPAAAK